MNQFTEVWIDEQIDFVEREINRKQIALQCLKEIKHNLVLKDG